MKLDLHMHPLCHEYYDGWSLPHNVKTLTDDDKQRIRAIVDWNIRRGMDVISVTDHDMVLPSLYAVEYVKQEGLPIVVIPGIEMELHHKGKERVHLCAWGIKEQPKYAHVTPIDEVVKHIHDLGGIVCMNHPFYSRQAFSEAYNLVDGYEYWNCGDSHSPFESGRTFLSMIGYELKEYANSDFHYDPCNPYYPDQLNEKYYPRHWNEWDDAEGKKWLEQFK